MIELKYNVQVDKQVVINSLKRLTNQVYKLLPMREEQVDWSLPLSTIMEELSGIKSLWLQPPQELFILFCKLEGLSFLKEKEDFFLYRRVIFDCLHLISSIVNTLEG